MNICIKNDYSRGLISDDSGTSADKKMKASDYDLLNCQDDEKRRVRRERNKVAAAKCRKRRVDLTNDLLTETEKLENIKSKLEEEIKILEIQRSDLQRILDSHSVECTNVVGGGVIKEEKHFFDGNGRDLDAGFPYRGCSNTPYGGMEKSNPDSTGSVQLKNLGASPAPFRYPPPPLDFCSKPMSYVNNKNMSFDVLNNPSACKGNGLAFQHPSYAPMPSQLRCPKSNATFSPGRGYIHPLEEEMYANPNVFSSSIDSYAMDLSHPSNGFRPAAAAAAADGNHRRPMVQESLVFQRHYQTPCDEPEKDFPLKYADISCNRPSKLLSGDSTKNYTNNNNNNYLSHPGSYYKDGGAFLEGSTMTTRSDIYRIDCPTRGMGSKLSACNRPDSLAFDRSFGSNDLGPTKAEDGVSPRYQKALELVMKTEDQCKMNSQ